MKGTRVRLRSLRKVFRSDLSRDFDVHLAQLCALYEDLRIELFGASADHLPHLDILDSASDHYASTPWKIGGYRRLYFVRRSMLTIREFAECLGQIRGCEEFAKLRLSVGDAGETFDQAVRFFSSNAQMFRTARNSVGAHFGKDAARYAVENFDANTIGRVELAWDETGATNMRLHFVPEIMSIALTEGLPGKTPQEQIEMLFSQLPEAYMHATKIVQAAVKAVLWARFG